MKDITIIMPFLNEGDEPKKTIENIYETTHKRNFAGKDGVFNEGTPTWIVSPVATG